MRRAGLRATHKPAAQAVVGLGATLLCVSCASSGGGSEYRFLAQDRTAPRPAPSGAVSAGSGAPVWPPPPDEPRVRYLGEFRGSEDVGAGRGNWLERLLFGEASAHVLVTPQSVVVSQRWAAVADPNAGVHRFNPRGDYEVLRSPGRSLYGRRHEDILSEGIAASIPVAVAAGGDALWVADAAARCVFLIQDGRDVQVLGHGVLKRPAGLAYCARRGVVRVADAERHEIVAFDLTGVEVGRVGHRGANPGEFNYPSHLASAADGRWAVADSLNFRVQVFDADDRLLMQVGGKGNAAGNLALPKGVAFDADGNLWVVDAQFENVQGFDREGRLLMAFGQEGHGPGEFWLPSGMCIDGKNRMWVADTYNRRVQVFELMRRVE